MFVYKGTAGYDRRVVLVGDGNSRLVRIVTSGFADKALTFGVIGLLMGSIPSFITALIVGQHTHVTWGFISFWATWAAMVLLPIAVSWLCDLPLKSWLVKRGKLVFPEDSWAWIILASELHHTCPLTSATSTATAHLWRPYICRFRAADKLLRSTSLPGEQQEALKRFMRQEVQPVAEVVKAAASSYIARQEERAETAKAERKRRADEAEARYARRAAKLAEHELNRLQEVRE